MPSEIASTALVDLKIAVVGAGCAGIAAAHRLQMAGATVTVFEKSRGVGGRLATRRIETRRFDHGAQFFSARGSEFLGLVHSLETEGVVSAWSARWGRYDGRQTNSEVLEEPRFAGNGGMNRIAKAMAETLTIVLGAEVSDLALNEHLWSLDFRSGDTRPGFDAVLLAVPGPQAVPLLTGISEFAIDVARSTYAPCWALMCEFPAPLPIAFDAVRIQDPILGWAARNASKPGCDDGHETWVLHGAPDWSLSYLEEPSEVIAEMMIERFRQIFSVSEAPTLAVAHRWRYALVQQSAEVPYFWDAALRIGACGDWCLGPRVEAAFDSGLALADAVIAGR